MTDVPRTRLLLFGVLVGPISWAIQHAVSYIVVSQTCGRTWSAVAVAASFAALAVTAVGLVSSLRSWRRLSEASDSSDPIIRRSRALAYAGALTCSLFLVVIAALGLPVLLLAPCR